jgi:hydroxyacylglutathione hydrolase
MITVKKIVLNSFQVNTYILSDETKEAIIIDPACENELEENELTDYISQNKLVPKAIVNTHAHIDHILGVDRIKKKYNIPFMLHAEDSFLVNTAPQSAQIFGFNFNSIPTIDKYIDETTDIHFGKSTLKAYHIPGHSPGSLVYYSLEDNFVIVGDVLFNGSIGRTDLPGGNYDSLISGIKEKLLSLPKETIVHCGHGPDTSIRKEHDTNPFLT